MKTVKKLSLYQKFVLVIICVGVIPMTLFSTVLVQRMLKEYEHSLMSNYEQAALYLDASLEAMMESYNDISKMPYYYNYSNEGSMKYNYMSFDNLRQMVYGIGYDPENLEEMRKNNMQVFLMNVQSVDSSLASAHFVARDLNGSEMAFHYSPSRRFFANQELFISHMGLADWDEESNQLMLIPPHKEDYFYYGSTQVFTVARNYFDLSKPVGQNQYVGTLFLDISFKKLEQMFSEIRFGSAYELYVYDQAGNCFYSNQADRIGEALNLEQLSSESNDSLVITGKPDQYGLSMMILMNRREALAKIYRMQEWMYLFLGASVVALLLASLVFSRQLTRPIRNMMEQMTRIESGDFDVQLPVESADEIGVLSARFNRMSQELRNYINQSYGARLKQNEAEMTALKSQIYPHFLYNTLEVIRMTALDHEDMQVPMMIEALSGQIHYMIGPMKDMVPLEAEVDVVRKYVYLLNCRIEGKIHFSADMDGLSGTLVPKLILQPIVENAYIHGIKPKDGSGHVLLEAGLTESAESPPHLRSAESNEGNLEISLMDNGVGMDEESLAVLLALLDGDAPGIKNENNWQSIGLKNVHDRIRYLYGDGYGIRITSTKGVGTMVRLVMPYFPPDAGKEVPTDA